MRHHKHKTTTHAFGKPENWDDSKGITCDTLPVSVDENGPYRVMRSFWKPTLEELAVLAAGGSIELAIYSSSHPPVMLSVVEDGEVPA